MSEGAKIVPVSESELDEADQVDAMKPYIQGSFARFKCEDCGQIVKTVGAIKRHYKTEHDKNLDVEELSELQIDDSEQNEDQLESVNKEGFTKTADSKISEEILCHVCSKQYTTKGHLRNHMEKCHRDLSQDYLHDFFEPGKRRSKRILTENCILCTKKFRTRIALLNHYHHIHKIRSSSWHQIGNALDEINSLQADVSPLKKRKFATPHEKAVDDMNVDEFSQNGIHDVAETNSNLQNEPILLDDNLVEDEVEVTTSVEEPNEFLDPNQDVVSLLQTLGSQTSSKSSSAFSSQNQFARRAAPGYTTSCASDINAQSYSINGLDDLLTFDSSTSGETNFSRPSHAVCKICFEAFSTWHFLQTHYAQVHKLHVICHVI